MGSQVTTLLWNDSGGTVQNKNERHREILRHLNRLAAQWSVTPDSIYARYNQKYSATYAIDLSGWKLARFSRAEADRRMKGWCQEAESLLRDQYGVRDVVFESEYLPM